MSTKKKESPKIEAELEKFYDRIKETRDEIEKNLCKKKMRFVVQKHHASHLHYDLRLEMDGVLKSWAIPKEPPSAPGIKRLAIAVEDHDLSYINFEGVIPEGMYGAGIVEIWDKGEYELLEKTPDKIEFYLKGEKLHGYYSLIKFKDNWLFLKHRKESSID